MKTGKGSKQNSKQAQRDLTALRKSDSFSCSFYKPATDLQYSLYFSLQLQLLQVRNTNEYTALLNLLSFLLNSLFSSCFLLLLHVMKKHKLSTFLLVF